MLEVTTEFAQNITFNHARIQKVLPAGHLDATTLADYLVNKVNLLLLLIIGTEFFFFFYKVRNDLNILIQPPKNSKLFYKLLQLLKPIIFLVMKFKKLS